MFDRDGAPETGIATCLTPDGQRAWATATGTAAVTRMVADDVAGATVHIGRGELSF
jgi:hypothetical protein